MTKNFLLKVLFYSVLPCLLAGAAIFLNNQFKPQLQWQLKLLESDNYAFRIEGLGNNITTLFERPSIKVYSKEGYRCIYTGNILYVQNRLLENKITLQNLIGTNNSLAYMIFMVTVLHLIGSPIYFLLKPQVGWGGVSIIILIVACIAIIGISLFGPLTSMHFACIADGKIQATLTNISFDGLFYVFPGDLASILAIATLVKGYRLIATTPKDTLYSIRKSD